MRYWLLTVLTVAMSTNLSIAQQRFTAPLQGSVILKDVDDKYNASVYSLEMPEPDADADQERLQKIKEYINHTFFHKKRTGAFKTTAAAVPIVDYHYQTDTVPGIPPDNDMAANRTNRSVSVINSAMTVHDASTGAMLYKKNLKALSLSVGLNNISSDFRYDPKVMYDPDADRFICVMLNGTNAANYIVIGFSGSNKPDSVWNFYKFYGDYRGDTTWFDFPSVAMTQKEFFFTGNKIKYGASWQSGFTRSVIYQINKEDGYKGASSLNYQIWDSVTYNGNFIRNLYPVKGGNSLKGPEQYFLSNRNFDVLNDTIFLIKMPDTIGGTGSISVKALTAPVYYGVPPDGRQPDTGATLATNDGRILGAFTEGNKMQFVSATVDTATGASGVYHGIITDFASSSPTLQTNIIAVDTLDFGYPNVTSIATPGSVNESIISFNYTGPSTFPGVGAIFFDGTQYSPLLKVKQGDNSIKILAQKQQRWGDYMGAQVDWTDFAAIWVEGIYGRFNNNYGSYIVRLKSPDYTAIPENKVANTQQSILYPNPAWEFVEYTFDLKEGEVVNFMIYDIKGKVVDKILSSYCAEGKNMIRFNVASLVPGTYYFKAIGEKGISISTHSFVKQ